MATDSSKPKASGRSKVCFREIPPLVLKDALTPTPGLPLPASAVRLLVNVSADVGAAPPAFAPPAAGAAPAATGVEMLALRKAAIALESEKPKSKVRA